MKKQQFAEMLNGREYGEEITKEEANQAKASGLLVIFGYSDDNMEVRGIQEDEFGCCNGKTFLVDKKGVLPGKTIADLDTDDEVEIKDFLERKERAKKLKAVWCEAGKNCSWTYKTEVPHSTFNIMEDGDLYCIGIVIDSLEVQAGTTE